MSPFDVWDKLWGSDSTCSISIFTTLIYYANISNGHLVPKWRRIKVDATSSHHFYVMCPLARISRLSKFCQ